MQKKLKLYPIGSFTDFRDNIGRLKSKYLIADARKHRQSASAKTVEDDMSMARDSPVSLVVFEDGKRGVMSYAEYGASSVHNNYRVAVDEDRNPDPLLVKSSNCFYKKISDALDFLLSAPINVNRIDLVESKYSKNAGKNVIPCKTIYFCGDPDADILKVIRKAEAERRDKDFVFASDDVFKDYKNILKYDLVVANFPKDMDWNRKACFMMGAAYAHDISIVLLDHHDCKYPPLNGLARRHMGHKSLLAYITNVDDLNIGKEAAVMYKIFKEERAEAQGSCIPALGWKSRSKIVN